MTDLLELAVSAHGGLERWNKVKSIKGAASITGAIWFIKSKGDALKDVVMKVEPKQERLTMELTGQDKRSIFQPSRVTIERMDGTVITARDDPEKSFAGHQLSTPWDDIHVAYFSGEALWTYLTPFLYTYEGFVTEEIADIRVDGETWRRLRVTFPDYVKSHTREQISCFGPDGLLRRHDYTVDILGGATGLNYASEYRDVGGLIFPGETPHLRLGGRLSAGQGTVARRHRHARHHPALAETQTNVYPFAGPAGGETAGARSRKRPDSEFITKTR